MHHCKSTMVKTESSKQKMFRNTESKAYHQYKILRCFPVQIKKLLDFIQSILCLQQVCRAGNAEELSLCQALSEAHLQTGCQIMPLSRSNDNCVWIMCYIENHQTSSTQFWFVFSRMRFFFSTEKPMGKWLKIKNSMDPKKWKQKTAMQCIL